MMTCPAGVSLQGSGKKHHVDVEACGLKATGTKHLAAISSQEEQDSVIVTSRLWQKASRRRGPKATGTKHLATKMKECQSQEEQD